MRRLSVGLLVTVLVSLGTVAATSSPAWTAWECDRVSETGLCLDDEIPGTPPDGEGEKPGSNVPQTCPSAPGGRCVDEYGNIWLDEAGCYASMVQPQPEVGSRIWEQIVGDVTEGSVWACSDGRLFGRAGEPPVVDAEGVARTLVVRAPFEIAEVQLAPDPAVHTYVNVRNWVWVPAAQWHDVSVSLSTNGATVTLQAAPSKLEVDMGDGAASLVCRSAGRQWRQGMTDAATTSCGYAYQQASDGAGGFAVRGRLHYAVEWTCSGNCSATSGELGEFPAPPGATQQIDVRQRQTVVTN